jgi:hypothetical protein
MGIVDYDCGQSIVEHRLNDAVSGLEIVVNEVCIDDRVAVIP